MKRPVLLFVDGYSTHISQKASDVCAKKRVVLYSLLEHASHLIQPCDLRLSSSLKKTLDSVLRDLQIGQYVTKFEFASILKHAWNKSSKGGKKIHDAELFPFNKVVLKTEKMQMSRLFVSTSDTLSSVHTCVASTVTSPDKRRSVPR